MPPKRYDASLKRLLEAYPEDWVNYLLRCLGLPSTRQVRAVDTDVSTVSAAADKVLRLGGRDPWLLHLELQASHDRALARRLLLYNVLMGEQHGLDVRSVAVLLRREADRASLTGVLRQYRPKGHCYLEFHYDVIRLWQQPVESLLTGGLGLLPLAPLAAVPADAVGGVIRRMEERITAEAAPAQASELWAATYVLLGLQFDAAVATQLLKGIRTMEESTTYRAIVKKGMVVAAHELIEEAGSKHLGPLDKEMRAALLAIQEYDSLKRLHERISEVSSWAELLATPRPSKRAGRGKKNA